jgi:hypothetical protein
VSPDPEKLARTWSPSLMSLIEARLPSRSTSVLESTFSGCPATVSVLLDRSNRSTDPWTSDDVEVESVVDEAVAPELSVVPPVVPLLDIEPEVEVEVSVLVPLVDGEVVPGVDGVVPIEPLLVSAVFAEDDDPVVLPLL